jgi:hypothetical protein
MKALARSYVWWPGIDSEIEGLAKGCSGCQRVQHAPKCSPLHPWEWPSTPWQRIHVDFAGPFLGMMFLVIVDFEIAPNVIWRRHIDQLLASENINDTQDLEPVTDIPGLANENNAEDETAVDIQDQQRL